MDATFINFMEQYLDTAQVARFRDAQEFLREPVPMSKDAKGRVWASTNLQFQNDLDNMKAHVAFYLSNKKATLFSTKQELLTSAKDEGMKSAGEREAYCYSDAKFTVQSQEVEKLQTVYDRVNSLTWVMKSQLALL